MCVLRTAAYNTSQAANTNGTENASKWAASKIRPNANASHAASTAASTARLAVIHEGRANKPPTSSAAKMALLSHAVLAKCSGAAPSSVSQDSAAP